jgi:glycosyltransferase involved in cell wall biosynthesis
MLVSAIMPTRGRPEFAAAALLCFFNQTWPEKELVIADDADNLSFPNGLEGPEIQYHRLARRLTVGAKRNICCSRARGECVIHLDDDDWSAPGRFADQLARLVQSGKAVTSYDAMEFRHVGEAARWRYKGSPIGSSLCYRRAWWLEHPFEDRQSGQDERFAIQAGAHGVSVDAGNFMWASVHPGNTSVRDFSKQEWTQIAA